MQPLPSNASLLRAEGVIQQVDTVNRELRVLVNEAPLIFDVPPDCTVVLNAEQVKLRLLQPADHVEVTYQEDARGPRMARRVEAHAGNSSLR